MNNISPSVKTKSRLKRAIRMFERHDKVGVTGMTLGTGAGVAGGSVAAGSLASAAGATTWLGSTTLANLVGGVLVTTTPVGWLIGCGIAGGLAGYGIAKMIRSGGKQDQIRQDLASRLKVRLRACHIGEALQSDMSLMQSALSKAIKQDLIKAEQAERLVGLVEAGKLDVHVALDRLNAINNTVPMTAG